jgi:hypothetical membrane protein
MTRGPQRAADHSAHPDMPAPSDGNEVAPTTGRPDASAVTAGLERAQRPAPSAWNWLGPAAGVAGPVAFTLAWVSASLRQPGESFTAVQISGLAAENARDPWIMITGFVLLGCCAVVFGAALRRALGGGRRAGPGPAVIQAAGVLTIAVGLLRRDHVLLTAGAQSWHNQAHDVVSAVAYVLLIAAPLLLARRLRPDRDWHGLAVPLAAAAVASAGLLVFFYSAPHSSWDGLLQRVAVSLPLAAIAAVAGRLALLSRRARRAGCPRPASWRT